MRLTHPILLTASVPFVLADWQYLSRPDLSPPKLNITIPAHPSVEPGYLFITPYPGVADESIGPEQPGGYIFRDDGDLVWSSTGYLAGWVADFRPTAVNGQTVLRTFQGRMEPGHGRMYGDHSVLNDRYETVKIVRAASHRLVSCHEFEVVGGRSVLIETPVPVLMDLSPFGGDEEQRWVLSSGFQEIDINTGELIFEWYSADHVSPKHSILPLPPNGTFDARSSLDAWDYFHLNSAQKDTEGNYLISARNSAIFKINGTNGKILWQLGGTNSDFTIPANAQFAFQHDARIRYRSADGQIERISLFDNAAHTASGPGPALNPFSRARYIELDHSTKSVRELRTYRPPDDLLATSQGNVQFLPGGNVFVNWGEAGAVTEYTEQGDVLFHAYLDSEPNRHVQSYRGFRYPWTGYSPEEPAVLALGNDQDGRVTVYVSWNGDTVTDVWYFYLIDGGVTGDVEERYLGKAKRTRFETSFQTRVELSSGGLSMGEIVVEARDAKGKVLGRSRATGLTDSALYISSGAVLTGQLHLGSAEFDQRRLEL